MNAPLAEAATPDRPRVLRGTVRTPLVLSATATFVLVLGCSNESPTPSRSSTEAERLRHELASSVRDELRDELRPVVMDELRRELARPDATNPTPPDPTPPNTPDTIAEQAAPHAGTPPAANTEDASPTAPSSPSDLQAPGGELWNRPGTTIWPTRGGLRLVELTVGTGLEEKLPIGIESHYSTVPEILFCYSVFENPDPDQTVTHVWRRSGRLVSKVELEVGKSPKWRTWSKQRTAPHWRGVWSCEVLSTDGLQLGLHVFQVGG